MTAIVIIRNITKKHPQTPPPEIAPPGDVVPIPGVLLTQSFTTVLLNSITDGGYTLLYSEVSKAGIKSINCVFTFNGPMEGIKTPTDTILNILINSNHVSSSLVPIYPKEVSQAVIFWSGLVEDEDTVNIVTNSGGVIFPIIDGNFSVSSMLFSAPCF